MPITYLLQLNIQGLLIFSDSELHFEFNVTDKRNMNNSMTINANFKYNCKVVRLTN